MSYIYIFIFNIYNIYIIYIYNIYIYIYIYINNYIYILYNIIFIFILYILYIIYIIYIYISAGAKLFCVILLVAFLSGRLEPMKNLAKFGFRFSSQMFFFSESGVPLKSTWRLFTFAMKTCNFLNGRNLMVSCRVSRQSYQA